MQRIIEAPGKELLEDKEAAEWLSLSVEKFRELVKDGVIPPADVEFSRQERRWRWDTVWATGKLLGHLIALQMTPSAGGK